LTCHPASPDGIAVPYRTEQVLLTLAGLAYRGFHELLGGAPHADAVRRALLDGLHTLPSVRDEWMLVWGPVTSRSGPDAPRRTVLEPLIPVITTKVKAIDYRQARAGVTTFEGSIRGKRSFEAEFVHQHLDAYLAELGLLDKEMSALTFFF
jgi:hypothetical protein